MEAGSTSRHLVNQITSEDTKFKESSETQNVSTIPYSSDSSVFKKDNHVSRPCAVIGPGVIPPYHRIEGYVPHGWSPASEAASGYYKQAHVQFFPERVYPPRNISPRHTFQENMSRIIVPSPTEAKYRSEHFIPSSQSALRNSAESLKSNNSQDAKFCDIARPQYSRSGDMPPRLEPQGSPAAQYAVHGYPSSKAPMSPYSNIYNYAPEFQRHHLDYQNPGVQLVKNNQIYQKIPEPSPYLVANDSAGMYARISNGRHEPYQVPKDKYVHPRYEYQYSNQYPPVPSYGPLQKCNDPKKRNAIQPEMKYYQMSQKYIDPHIFSPNSDLRNKVSSKRSQSNVQYHLADIHGHSIDPYNNQGKIYGLNVPDRTNSYSANSRIVPETAKFRIDYLNHYRGIPYSDAHLATESLQNQHYSKSNIPTYPMRPPDVNHSYSSVNNVTYHKSVDEPNDWINECNTPNKLYYNQRYAPYNPLAKIPTEFSPNIISPTESSTSFDSIHTVSHQLYQEDGGYVSQCSTASGKSAEYQHAKHNNGKHNIYYDSPNIHAHIPSYPMPNTEVRCDKPFPKLSSMKNSMDVRQFLKMWNEEIEDSKTVKVPAEMSVKSDNLNIFPQMSAPECPTLPVSEQLYVLDKVNIPVDDLYKYEHLQKITKLPDNIKDYDHSENLKKVNLKQGRQIISDNPYFNANVKKDHFIGTIKPMVNIIQESANELVDVEAKISQSIIHKDVGCNFEIKPCSPVPSVHNFNNRVVASDSNKNIAVPATAEQGSKHSALNSSYSHETNNNGYKNNLIKNTNINLAAEVDKTNSTPIHGEYTKQSLSNVENILPHVDPLRTTKEFFTMKSNQTSFENERRETVHYNTEQCMDILGKHADLSSSNIIFPNSENCVLNKKYDKCINQGEGDKINVINEMSKTNVQKKALINYTGNTELKICSKKSEGEIVIDRNKIFNNVEVIQSVNRNKTYSESLNNENPIKHNILVDHIHPSKGIHNASHRSNNIDSNEKNKFNKAVVLDIKIFKPKPGSLNSCGELKALDLSSLEEQRKQKIEDFVQTEIIASCNQLELRKTDNHMEHSTTTDSITGDELVYSKTTCEPVDFSQEQKEHYHAFDSKSKINNVATLKLVDDKITKENKNVEKTDNSQTNCKTNLHYTNLINYTFPVLESECSATTDKEREISEIINPGSQTSDKIQITQDHNEIKKDFTIQMKINTNDSLLLDKLQDSLGNNNIINSLCEIHENPLHEVKTDYISEISSSETSQTNKLLRSHSGNEILDMQFSPQKQNESVLNQSEIIANETTTNNTLLISMENCEMATEELIDVPKHILNKSNMYTQSYDENNEMETNLAIEIPKNINENLIDKSEVDSSSEILHEITTSSFVHEPVIIFSKTLPKDKLYESQEQNKSESDLQSKPTIIINESSVTGFQSSEKPNKIAGLSDGKSKIIIDEALSLQKLHEHEIKTHFKPEILAVSVKNSINNISVSKKPNEISAVLLDHESVININETLPEQNEEKSNLIELSPIFNENSINLPDSEKRNKIIIDLPDPEPQIIVNQILSIDPASKKSSEKITNLLSTVFTITNQNSVDKVLSSDELNEITTVKSDSDSLIITETSSIDELSSSQEKNKIKTVLSIGESETILNKSSLCTDKLQVSIQNNETKTELLFDDPQIILNEYSLNSKEQCSREYNDLNKNKISIPAISHSNSTDNLLEPENLPVHDKECSQQHTDIEINLAIQNSTFVRVSSECNIASNENEFIPQVDSVLIVTNENVVSKIATPLDAKSSSTMHNFSQINNIDSVKSLCALSNHHENYSVETDDESELLEKCTLPSHKLDSYKSKDRCLDSVNDHIGECVDHNTEVNNQPNEKVLKSEIDKTESQHISTYKDSFENEDISKKSVELDNPNIGNKMCHENSKFVSADDIVLQSLLEKSKNDNCKKKSHINLKCDELEFTCETQTNLLTEDCDSIKYEDNSPTTIEVSVLETDKNVGLCSIENILDVQSIELTLQPEDEVLGEFGSNGDIILYELQSPTMLNSHCEDPTDIIENEHLLNVSTPNNSHENSIKNDIHDGLDNTNDIVDAKIEENIVELGGCWIEDIACVETVVSEDVSFQCGDEINAVSPENSWGSNLSDDVDDDDSVPYSRQEKQDVSKDSNSNLILKEIVEINHGTSILREAEECSSIPVESLEDKIFVKVELNASVEKSTDERTGDLEELLPVYEKSGQQDLLVIRNEVLSVIQDVKSQGENSSSIGFLPGAKIKRDKEESKFVLSTKKYKNILSSDFENSLLEDMLPNEFKTSSDVQDFSSILHKKNGKSNKILKSPRKTPNEENSNNDSFCARDKQLNSNFSTAKRQSSSFAKIEEIGGVGKKTKFQETIMEDQLATQHNFREHSTYHFSKGKLITKGAKKYIPPDISKHNLKCKLPLPENILMSLSGSRKRSQSDEKSECTVSGKQHKPNKLPKKPKRNFEDVLKQIDETNIFRSKKKLKKCLNPNPIIPKMIIKKNETGSHYTSASIKRSYTPDLTGNKWQPWVTLQRNAHIEKMIKSKNWRVAYTEHSPLALTQHRSKEDRGKSFQHKEVDSKYQLLKIHTSQALDQYIL